MFSQHELLNILRDWESVVGPTPRYALHSQGRELWRVNPNDTFSFFLKRLGPWRNLPLEDEANVLQHLAENGIRVARFVPTDCGNLFAGKPEDSFVLIPELESRPLAQEDVMNIEANIGATVARLHVQLAAYSEPVNSYTETVLDSIQGSLNLPEDLANQLQPRIAEMAATFHGLTQQLIHGDLTPENIILCASDEEP